MFSQVETFESGWVGVRFALSLAEIDTLIERLICLKNEPTEHFHFRTNNFENAPGIADVEISILGRDEKNNMSIE